MLREVDALPDLDPAPVSVEIMSIVDTLPKPFRSLVHEYGFTMVVAMIEDGAENARNLERDLKTWRSRRQAELLA